MESIYAISSRRFLRDTIRAYITSRHSAPSSARPRRTSKNSDTTAKMSMITK